MFSSYQLHCAPTPDFSKRPQAWTPWRMPMARVAKSWPCFFSGWPSSALATIRLLSLTAGTMLTGLILSDSISLYASLALVIVACVMSIVLGSSGEAHNEHDGALEAEFTDTNPPAAASFDH
jgi:hypothetical protein